MLFVGIVAVVLPIVGFVGLSDACPGMWTSVVTRTVHRKCLYDIVGLRECRIDGLSGIVRLSGIVGHCQVNDGLY